MESIFVKFAQYPSIETERLLLRPVTLDDAETMFEYALRQRKYTLHFSNKSKLRRNQEQHRSVLLG